MFFFSVSYVPVSDHLQAAPPFSHFWFAMLESRLGFGPQRSRRKMVGRSWCLRPGKAPLKTALDRAGFSCQPNRIHHFWMCRISSSSGQSWFCIALQPGCVALSQPLPIGSLFVVVNSTGTASRLPLAC